MRNCGTSLNDLLRIDKSRLNAVQKQFIVGIKENPNLYGYRGFRPNGENPDITSSCAFDCSKKDEEDFIASATDPSAYMATTCWYVFLHCLLVIFFF